MIEVNPLKEVRTRGLIEYFPQFVMNVGSAIVFFQDNESIEPFIDSVIPTGLGEVRKLKTDTNRGMKTTKREITRTDGDWRKGRTVWISFIKPTTAISFQYEFTQLGRQRN